LTCSDLLLSLSLLGTQPPDSITSAPHEQNGEVLTFHIKVLGDWTHQVYGADLAHGHTLTSGSARIRLDGFYGADLAASLKTKSMVVLIGGGIGITPMISVAMDICTTSTTPVTLIWVVRSVDEFLIFADKLCDAETRFGDRLNVKVWITLKHPKSEKCAVMYHGPSVAKLMKSTDKHKTHRDSISPDLPIQADSSELVVHAKRTNSIQAIPTEPTAAHKEATKEILLACKEHMNKLAFAPSTASDKGANASLFTPNKTMVGNAANAFACCLAITFGLLGLALSKQKQNEWEKAHEDTDAGAVLQDNNRMQELFYVLLFVMIAFAVAAGCRFLTYYTIRKNLATSASLPAVFDIELRPNPIHPKSSAASARQLTHPSVNDSAGGTASNARSDHDELIKKMIKNHLGKRPDIAAELDAAATGLKPNSNAIVDVGVLACGPKKLVESVTTYCNLKTHTEIPGSPQFDFTEEDWNW
jgi:hypothetical protein